MKKTAAVCVAKLYDISPELVRDQGFIDTLRDLISDANPSVRAPPTHIRRCPSCCSSLHPRSLLQSLLVHCVWNYRPTHDEVLSMCTAWASPRGLSLYLTLTSPCLSRVLQVVANAVAALSEIQESSSRDVFDITSAVLQKLLAALNECTEWGQVFILDSLGRYTPLDGREAETIIERVLPRLNHQNPAVVLSAVKIVVK